MKSIFKQSIDLFGEDVIRREVKEVRVDTTVQEKNITFPTDRKLNEKAKGSKPYGLLFPTWNS